MCGLCLSTLGVTGKIQGGAMFILLIMKDKIVYIHAVKSGQLTK